MISRRSFLKFASCAAVLSVVDKSIFARGLDHSSLLKDQMLIWGAGTTIKRLNFSDRTIDAQPIAASCHGFLPVPGEPHKIITIEKWRSRMLMVDFKNPAKTIRVFSGRDRRFYGHGVLCEDHKHLMTIQVDNESKKTYLTIHRLSDLKKVDEIEIGIGGAHEMSFLPDRRHLVIATTGWVPKIGEKSLMLSQFERVDYSKLVFIDTSTFKVINEQALYNTRLSLAHLKVDANGKIFAISDIMHPRVSQIGAGGIHTTELFGKIQDLEVPTQLYRTLKGEFLSVEVNPLKPLVAVTNPYGGQVLVYNTDTLKLLTNFESNTTGVAWSKDGEILYILNRVSHIQGLEPYQSTITRQVSNLFKIKQAADIEGTVSSHMLYV